MSPQTAADVRSAFRLLLIAIAMSIVMASTAAWVLRRPPGTADRMDR